MLINLVARPVLLALLALLARLALVALLAVLARLALGSTPLTPHHSHASDVTEPVLDARGAHDVRLVHTNLVWCMIEGVWFLSESIVEKVVAGEHGR
jgi:hypothetical protein